jgi:hypothetical protein
VCGSCRDKRTQCLYTCEPGVLRFAALEARYIGLETGYSNLSKLYERLKRGSISQALSLVERIRLEDEVLDMTKDNGPFAGSMDHTRRLPLASGPPKDHGWPQVGFGTPLKRTISLPSDQATRSSIHSGQVLSTQTCITKWKAVAVLRLRLLHHWKPCGMVPSGRAQVLHRMCLYPSVCRTGSYYGPQFPVTSWNIAPQRLIQTWTASGG